jgi:hypothetical protein
MMDFTVHALPMGRQEAVSKINFYYLLYSSYVAICFNTPGKTYTMQGTTQHPGISKNMLREVFESKIKRESSGLQTVTICVSMIEVYNETFRVFLCSIM